MNTLLVAALIALTANSCLGAPSNDVQVITEEIETKEVVGVKKGSEEAMEFLDKVENDKLVRVCDPNSCMIQDAASVKAQSRDYNFASLVKSGDSGLSAALYAPQQTLLESMKGVQSQKQMLENLNAQLEALTSQFAPSTKASNNANQLYTETITKGINFAPPPAPAASKGMSMAYASSKGLSMAPRPPSKGASAAASSMQLEAAMCPMTMYELGKSQKLTAEMKSQLDTANSMNAYLSSQKSSLESQLNVCEVSKAKEAEQARFNAKYAAEQKNRADMLERALALANAEKASLERQKAALESNLAITQAALAAEKQTTAMLTDALGDCNQEKAQLEAEKAALIDELESTQNVLRNTQRELENEQLAHARTQRQLEDTQEELQLSEGARRQLEEAKQQLEDELAETKSELEVMTAERDTLQTSLDATSAMLATCNEDKLKCQVDLAQEKAISSQLSQQLQDAMELLAAEKAAREELTNTIMMVKEASEKVQAEVQRLQLENVQLQQQIAKLRSEQETAMAMAAGCPPTYEKFGLSCYKYVREKTQWKMAQEQCMKDGGNLVAVESRQEQAFLVDYLKRHEARFDDKYLHLGGYDYNANGVFKWITTKNPVDFGDTFWLSSNPRGQGRRCLSFQTWEMAQFGEWADEYCWVMLPFVCEFETAPSLY